MSENIHRRRFIALTALSAVSSIAIVKNAKAQQQPLPQTGATLKNDTTPAPKRPPRPDPLAAELVKEWVGKAHSDFAYIKAAFEKEPRLLNAAWDWGGGDFETALEAAGHVGNKEIANFLLAQGARMNVFCAAMLGKLDIVKSILTTFSDLKESKGPHGLQLMHHAKKGGAEAQAVLDYLVLIDAK